MRNLKVTWKGATPLIMHSCQCVNPLHPISIEMKKYTSKRKKTEDDLIKISDLEWESGIYWDNDINGPYVPAENIEATMINGGKSFKKGADIQKYCGVSEVRVPLNYGTKLTKEQLIADYHYRDTRAMTVQRAKIMRTRPRFDRWEITFNMHYDEDKIDLETIKNAVEYAGKYVGLCDSRPKYGQFSVVIEELD